MLNIGILWYASALVTNINLFLKKLEVKNTLAYSALVSMTNVKGY